MQQDSAQAIKVYSVWDLPVRLFHWVNFLSVISLLFMGFVMLYKKELGISSLEAKIALKEVHVIIGYLFAINLSIRFVWGFVGNRFARWSALLPGLSGFAAARQYLRDSGQGKALAYLGHNPAGRLAVSLLLLLLLVMAVTGLVRAGTDIYYPPFGSQVQAYIAAEGVDASTIQPYDESRVDAGKFAEMKAFKGPFGDIHLYTAYLLMALILLHIGAVVIAEKREGGALVSAMFNGRKYISGQPVDGEK